MISKKQSVLVILTIVIGSAHVFAGADTRSVVTTRTIQTSPEDVLTAFLDDGDLKAWWKVSRSLVEPEKGGIWSVTWDDWGEEKTHHAWSGVIEDLTPNRLLISRLVMNEPGMPLLGPMQLEISVKPAAGGTSLTVSHRGYRYGGHWDRIYYLVVNGWDHVLGDMQQWVGKQY